MSLLRKIDRSESNIDLYRERLTLLNKKIQAAITVMLLALLSSCDLASSDKNAGQTEPTVMISMVNDNTEPDYSENTEAGEEHAGDPDPSEVSEEPTVETSASEPEKTKLLVSFIGDCTLAEALQWKGSSKGFEAVVGDDYKYCFKNAVEVLSEDDMTLANFEGTLTNVTQHRTKEFCFAASPEYVNILTEGSIECVNLANNHTDDYWDQGKADTRSALEGAGILWSDETATAIYECKGIKIGMAGTTFPTNREAMFNAIDELRAEGCQIVIISCHWGIEKDYKPRSDQVSLGHDLIDHGADIVIGTHPHRLQPIELYNGRYIAYCLSNFCFGGNTGLGDPDSVILQCEFTMDPTDSKVESYELNVIPYCQTTVWPGNDYCPRPYEWASEDYYRVMERLEWSQEDE